MEIRIFLCYIYISCCALIITYLEAKPVSLNDIIAAEEQAAQHSTTSRSPISKIYTETGASVTQRTKTSPLKYKQAFQIKSPSKPNKLKVIQRPRQKRKKLQKKRETNHNDGIIQKYIPVLKNLKLLFDNILGSDSSETHEPRTRKLKRNPFTSNDRKDIVCTCERKSTTESTIHPQKETSPSTSALSNEVENANVASTIVTTTSTYIIVNDNISSVGRYKNIPVLFTRNPIGVWRNDSGLGQGSGSSLNGSFEGHFTGDNGNNERVTRGETESYTKNYKEYTDSSTRNDASRNRTSEQLRGIRIQPRNSEIYKGTSKTDKPTFPRIKTLENHTRNLPKYEREVEYEIRRDETESALYVPKFASRLRGLYSQEKNTPVRTTEIAQESIQNIASDKRISSRDGSFASENQEISSGNEAIIPKHILPNSTFPVGKVVMIFDGYSVAKDVNGKNKLTEKAIHIHT